MYINILDQYNDIIATNTCKLSQCTFVKFIFWVKRRLEFTAIKKNNKKKTFRVLQINNSNSTKPTTNC